jgi:hypothetical protein
VPSCLTLLFPALWLSACAGEDDEPTPPAAGRDWQPLALLDDWSRVARADDPLIEEPSAVAECRGAGFWLERDLGWLEIDSGACGWVTLRAPARGEVVLGQELALAVSHYDLIAGAPAEASLRLLFEDCQVWSRDISIPSPAAVYEEQFASPCALGENAPILFHVHNHGQNTYQFRGILALR